LIPGCFKWMASGGVATNGLPTLMALLGAIRAECPFGAAAKSDSGLSI
jgi:hypothetical protein